MPVTSPVTARWMIAATSVSQMNTNGDFDPRIFSSRGRWKSAVIWLSTRAPRIVPMRSTTCSRSGRDSRRSASISSTMRLWSAYANSSLPRTGWSSVIQSGLSGW